MTKTDCDASSPEAKIMDRGRGPELVGTRITVYRIMDYLIVPGEYTPEEIASELQITPAQVHAAIDYIAGHRPQIEAEYAEIMSCIRRGNPPWVDEGRTRTIEELRERIMGRHAQKDRS